MNLIKLLLKNKQTLATFACIVFSFIAVKVYAAEGVIIALEAPLISSPNESGKVVKVLRKGDKIYLHKKHDGLSPYEIDYTPELSAKYDKIDQNSDYYTTLDNLGNDAYIQKKYVKLILNDTREFDTPLSVTPHDDTDYRITEPLIDTYPFFVKNLFRAELASMFMAPEKDSYQYKITPKNANESAGAGAVLNYLRKIPFDKTNRIYFGGSLSYYYSSSYYDITSTIATLENNNLFQIGPMIQYDIHRTERGRITISAGINLTYYLKMINAVDISIEDQSRGQANATLYSLYLSPNASAGYHLKTFIPNLDLYVNGFFTLHHPRTFTTSQNFDGAIGEKIATRTQSPSGFGGNAGLMLGFTYSEQSRY